MESFSPVVLSRSIRTQHVNGAFWGAYGSLITVTGAIFTGFALWMGLEAADIALIASIAALAGLIQPFSFLIAGRMRNQKAFVIRFGLIEITLTTGVVFVPLLVGEPGPRFILAAIATLSGVLMGNLVSPHFNSWFSTILPEGSRARILSRRFVITNLAAMAVGYAAGRYIDFTHGRYVAFAVSFAVAWLVGAGGYLVLLAVPFPSVLKVEGEISFGRALVTPFKDAKFRRLLIFYCIWVFGILLAEPFYSVFMIRDLEVSYAAIGILNGITLAVGVVGYRLWGGVIERFGSKPVLQLLLIPRLVLPFVWTWLTPQNNGVLLPIIMVTNGLVFSGLTVAVNTLLFGTIPERSDRSTYFAAWAVVPGLINAAATALGGLIARLLEGYHFDAGPIHLTNIKIIFLISSVLLVAPVIYVRIVDDTAAKPVNYLLGQMLRGNPLAFVYNAFVLSWTRGAKVRARAVRALGRSKSPMAVDRLVKAMDDLDPEVREEAAKGLGDTGLEHAVEPLVEELADEESDLRAEAAESLGRLRHPSGIDPLFRALDSHDLRVAISASRALGDIGGAAIKERLYRRLSGNPPASLIPSLVEALSRLEDLRVVRPALAALPHYKSPVIRMQLMNAVCRTLGAKDLFYALLSKDDLDVAAKLSQMVQTMARHIKRIAGRSREAAVERYAELVKTLEEGRYVELPKVACALADILVPKSKVAEEARDALRLYCDAHTGGAAERPEIFSVVCLGIIVDAML